MRYAPLPGQMRPMNGQDQYAPDRGVGGFPEFDPFSNKCANFWVLRSSVWRPLAGRCGRLLEVNLGVVELSWGSLVRILELSLANLNESLCSFAISMDQPEVRRAGFASFALLPPSRARAPLLLWERGSSGSGGGLCAMLEMPKFVPMARPYASAKPISLSIYNSRLRKLCTKPPPPRPDRTNERTRRIRTGSRRGRISGIRSFLEHVCQLLGPKVIRFEACSSTIWRALGSQFGSRGALREVSWKYPGSILGILMNFSVRSLPAWTSQRYEE